MCQHNIREVMHSVRGSVCVCGGGGGGGGLGFFICFFHCLIFHSVSVYFSFFVKNNVTGILHTASTTLTTTDSFDKYNPGNY